LREIKVKKIFVFVGVLFILISVLTPFLWMILVSLSKAPDFLVKGSFVLTLRNYIDLFSVRSLHFVDYLKNSGIVSFFASLFAALIGALAAYSITRLSIPFKIPIVLAALGLSMFPQISVVGYLYKIMSKFGFLNTYPALILPYIAWSLPLALWMLLGYFSQIPKEIDEAALIDGATRTKIIFKLVIPIAIPGFLSAFLLLLIFSFNEFLFALMLTTDFRARTVPVGIALFQGLHGEIPWGYIMAASGISCAPIILLAIFFQRYIIEGLTGGAVKG